MAARQKLRNERQLPNFSKYYIGDQGTIWSCIKHRYLKPYPNSRRRNSYLVVKMYDDDGRIHVRTVHRLVLEAFRGLPKPGYESRHLDSNSHNNSLRNLRWCTPTQNLRDRIKRGTLASWRTPLSYDDVRDIRALRGRFPAKVVAQKYNLSDKSIRLIWNGRTYSWLK